MHLSKRFASVISVVTVSFVLSGNLMAASRPASAGALVSAGASTPLANEFEYPELNVTPRASERVGQEAARESEHRWTRHAPILFSGLMTFSAGLLQLNYRDQGLDPDNRSAYAGIAVGGAWLAVTSWLAMSYNPYTSAEKELAGMPKKTTREQLTRERYAEQQIQSAASLACKLRWLSVLSNAGASAYMLAKVEKNSLGQVADGLALASALAPLVFRSYWQDVADEQADYKKRIYAPVAGAGFSSEPLTGTPSPTFFLSLFF